MSALITQTESTSLTLPTMPRRSALRSLGGLALAPAIGGLSLLAPLSAHAVLPVNTYPNGVFMTSTPVRTGQAGGGLTFMERHSYWNEGSTINNIRVYFYLMVEYFRADGRRHSFSFTRVGHATYNYAEKNLVTYDEVDAVIFRLSSSDLIGIESDCRRLTTFRINFPDGATEQYNEFSSTLGTEPSTFAYARYTNNRGITYYRLFTRSGSGNGWIGTGWILFTSGTTENVARITEYIDAFYAREAAIQNMRLANQGAAANTGMGSCLAAGTILLGGTTGVTAITATAMASCAAAIGLAINRRWSTDNNPAVAAQQIMRLGLAIRAFRLLNIPDSEDCPGI